MRARYESFGGIIALDEPTATVYVDQAYMRKLGYADSPLWHLEGSHLSAPVTAHFAVINRCSMGCQTCYNASGVATPGERTRHLRRGYFGELSTDEAKRVLDILAEMQVFTVAFGGGEPLARSDLFELARHARIRGLVPTLTTNGCYVDRQTAQRCRVFGYVHVSLDGVGETYRAVRGVDGFERAARALKLLVRSGVSVGINCLVCRANFDHLEALACFVQGCGVRDLTFLRLKPGSEAASPYEAVRLTAEQRLALYPLLRELAGHYDLQCHVDCAMMPLIYGHRPDKRALRLFAANGAAGGAAAGCAGANEIVEIRPDGRVRACSLAPSAVGEALRLPALWHTASSFERYRRWTESAPEPCRSCPYLERCRGGCHAVAAALTGDFNAPDPECPMVSGRKG